MMVRTALVGAVCIFGLTTTTTLAAPPVVTPAPIATKLSLLGLEPGTVIDPNVSRCVAVDRAPPQSILGEIWNGPRHDISIQPIGGRDFCLIGLDNQPNPDFWEATPHFTQPVPAGFSTVMVMIDRKTMIMDTVFVFTNGVEDQDEIFSALEAKFGPPQQLTRPQMQNAMGASFVGLGATWNFVDGAQLQFSSGFGRYDFGLVAAQSAKSVADQREKNLIEQQNQRPL